MKQKISKIEDFCQLFCIVRVPAVLTGTAIICMSSVLFQRGKFGQNCKI
jgi:hypothetical protein